MDPFELPPSTPPVSTAPPDPGGGSSGRGRMVVAAVAAVGLVGAGLVGVSQFVSADRPSLDGASAAVPEPTDDGTEPIDPVDEDDADGAPAGGDEESDGDSERPSIDGEIVIDLGDGDPIVVDLGEGTIDGQEFDRFAECAGLPVLPHFDFDVAPGDLPIERFEDLPLDDLDEIFDELGEGPFGQLEVFGGDGTHITVLGPDGVSVVDLGEGDGSVTITQDDGEVTITTEGDATVEDLSDVFGGFELDRVPPGEFDPGELFDEGMFDEFFDEFLDEGFLDEFLDEGLLDEGMFDESLLDEYFDQLPRGPRWEERLDDLDLPDPAEIEACLAEAGDR